MKNEQEFHQDLRLMCILNCFKFKARMAFQALEALPMQATFQSQEYLLAFHPDQLLTRFLFPGQQNFTVLIQIKAH